MSNIIAPPSVDGQIVRPNTLGRLYSPDPRDANFQMRSVLPKKASTRKYRYLNDTQWVGNQLSTPFCVGFSLVHQLHAGAITQPVTKLSSGAKLPVANPVDVYWEANANDEWSPTPHDGTSIRTGAKALQRRGLISSYYWGRGHEDVLQAVLSGIPVVVGTEWFYDMFFPDPETFIIKPTGQSVGGHGYCITGANVDTRLYRILNSWGNDWGNKGRASISFDHMDMLIKNYGEACIMTEIKQPKA